jgi:hypothetical protein
MSRTLFSISFLAITLFSLPFFVFGQEKEKTKPVEPAAPLELNIDLPGTAFSLIQKDKLEEVKDPETGRRVLRVAWLAYYIGALYETGIILGTILAVVMIMVGGFMWLAAGGSQGLIGTGKEYIKSAFVGLLLLLGSYIIILTINPGIAKFRSLNLILPKEIVFPKFCEDIIESVEYKGKITVDPPKSTSCGTPGTLSLTEEGQKEGITLQSTTCNFRGKCHSGSSCVLLPGSSAGGECASCRDLTKSFFSDNNVSGNQDYCSQADPQDNPPKTFDYCLWDTHLSNECRAIHIDCNAVRECSDYFDVSGTGSLDNDNRGKICTWNPCNIAGGCKLTGWPLTDCDPK